MNQEGKVSVCQFRPVIGDKKENITKIQSIVSSISSEVDVAVFPELCLSGYHLSNINEHSCNPPCEHTQRLSVISEDEDLMLVVGMPIMQDGYLYNSLVVINSSGIKSRYDKKRLAGDEKDVFEAGDENVCVETPAGRMGLMICYDMSFPEEMTSYGNQKCDFVAVSSAWRNGWHDDWRLIARTRALENSTYVVAPNQMGNQEDRFNDGESVIVSPYGNILSNLKQEKYYDSVCIDNEVLKNARSYNPVVTDR